jgi:hypothetical protein
LRPIRRRAPGEEEREQEGDAGYGH